MQAAIDVTSGWDTFAEAIGPIPPRLELAIRSKALAVKMLAGPSLVPHPVQEQCDATAYAIARSTGI
jgi:hypothetical protein